MTTHAESPWIPDVQTFATRLWAVRMRTELNKKDFAALCNLSPSNVNKWEGGQVPQQKDEVARKVAAATGCDPVWLAFGYPTSELDEWVRTGWFPALSALSVATPALTA